MLCSTSERENEWTWQLEGCGIVKFTCLQNQAEQWCENPSFDPSNIFYNNSKPCDFFATFFNVAKDHQEVVSLIVASQRACCELAETFKVALWSRGRWMNVCLPVTANDDWLLYSWKPSKPNLGNLTRLWDKIIAHFLHIDQF